jgi:hypothetical protein
VESYSNSSQFQKDKNTPKHDCPSSSNEKLRITSEFLQYLSEIEVENRTQGEQRPHEPREVTRPMSRQLAGELMNSTQMVVQSFLKCIESHWGKQNTTLKSVSRATITHEDYMDTAIASERKKHFLSVLGLLPPAFRLCVQTALRQSFDCPLPSWPCWLLDLIQRNDIIMAPSNDALQKEVINTHTNIYFSFTLYPYILSPIVYDRRED